MKLKLSLLTQNTIITPVFDDNICC